MKALNMSEAVSLPSNADVTVMSSQYPDDDDDDDTVSGDSDSVSASSTSTQTDNQQLDVDTDADADTQHSDTEIIQPPTPLQATTLTVMMTSPIMIYRVNTKKVAPTPATFVDISAVSSNFCMKFYMTVKRSNIHFITTFSCLLYTSPSPRDS